MTEKKPEAFHAVIEGRVQGVGFRYSTQRKASELGLTGWVRNRFDGTVEVLAEGPPEKLASFLTWLRSGPSFACVTKVDHRPVHPKGTYRGFSIAP